MPEPADIDPEHVAELERQLASTKALLAASEEANARLERLLAQAKHEKFGPSSEKGDPPFRRLLRNRLSGKGSAQPVHRRSRSG